MFPLTDKTTKPNMVIQLINRNQSSISRQKSKRRNFSTTMALSVTKQLNLIWTTQSFKLRVNTWGRTQEYVHGGGG